MSPSAAPSGESRARLIAVNVLFAVRDTDRPGYPIGIDKRPVAGEVAVDQSGVAGDRQVDPVNHGGPDKAAYAYAAEDLDRWSTQLGRPLTPGLFGENLTTAGLDITGAVIGEQWAIGDDGLRVEVTMPRTPCYKFAHRMGEQRWVRRFTDAGAPGAYLRVRVPGAVHEGAAIKVTHRPRHGVTIGDTFRDPQPCPMTRLLAAEQHGEVQLADAMRESVEFVAGVGRG